MAYQTVHLMETPRVMVSEMQLAYMMVLDLVQAKVLDLVRAKVLDLAQDWVLSKVIHLASPTYILWVQLNESKLVFVTVEQSVMGTVPLKVSHLVKELVLRLDLPMAKVLVNMTVFPTEMVTVLWLVVLSVELLVTVSQP
jgi:hypothetical protein